ncbi:MAG: hypothetical protein KDK24_10140 [Pseudooceanicola sp.]|nr:hypothetical protein [Pseudooceanicola sp.]
MPFRVIDTPADLLRVTGFLGRLKLPLTLSWVQGRDRTTQQNRLQWLWAGEVAEQLGGCTAADVQAEWKLDIGCPIMREQSETFSAAYETMVAPLPRESQIILMRDLDMGVTRLMKVPQMVRYMDAIQRQCAENGIRLTEPDPELAKYQRRYRAKEAA